MQASGDVQCPMVDHPILQNPFRVTSNPALESCPNDDDAHVCNATDVWSTNDHATGNNDVTLLDDWTLGSSGDIISGQMSDYHDLIRCNIVVI